MNLRTYKLQTDGWELKNIVFPFSIFALALIFRGFISRANIEYIEFNIDELSLSIALLSNSIRECLARRELPIPNIEWNSNKETWENIYLINTFIFFAIYIAFVVTTAIYECNGDMSLKFFIHVLTIISVLGFVIIIPLTRAVKSSFNLGRN